MDAILSRGDELKGMHMANILSLVRNLFACAYVAMVLQ